MRTSTIAGVAMTLCLATACNSGGSDTTSSSGNCDSKDPYKVGVVLPLSGAAAEGGKQTSTGIKIAVDDINAEGGVLGRCLTPVFKDDEADTTKAQLATRDLTDREEVGFIVGVINSSAIFPVSSVTTEAKKILVVGATDTIDYNKNPYVFRTEVTVTQIGAQYVDYMKAAGIERFGVLAVNNAYGEGVNKAVVTAAEKEGLTITKTEKFDPAALNLRTQVQSIKNSGAEALVTVVYGQAAIVALKAREEIGWDAPIFGSNGFATKEINDAVGDAGMAGLLVSPTYAALNRASGADDITDQVVVDFRSALAEEGAPAEDLIQQYVAGYDMVRIIADAINAVESDDQDKVKEYLETHPSPGIRANYTFSKNSHDGVPDDAIGMAVANSLKDGVLETASTEKK